MKQQADQHHSEQTFQVGDMVFLLRQPFKQSFGKIKGRHTMVPNFYGTYKFRRKLGFIDYKLELPSSSHSHPIFHVSCLKKFIGTKIKAKTILLELDNE